MQKIGESLPDNFRFLSQGMGVQHQLAKWPFKKLVLALLVTAWLAKRCHSSRRWLVGLASTLRSVLKFALYRRIQGRRDNVIGQLKEARQVLECPDGEAALIWWSEDYRALLSDSYPRVSSRRRHIWVILPGGMKNGGSALICFPLFLPNSRAHAVFRRVLCRRSRS